MNFKTLSVITLAFAIMALETAALPNPLVKVPTGQLSNNSAQSASQRYQTAPVNKKVTVSSPKPAAKQAVTDTHTLNRVSSPVPVVKAKTSVSLGKAQGQQNNKQGQSSYSDFEPTMVQHMAKGYGW